VSKTTAKTAYALWNSEQRRTEESSYAATEQDAQDNLRRKIIAAPDLETKLAVIQVPA
jgi:hypothetical protein